MTAPRASWAWITNRVSAGFAPVGTVFDPNDPVHMEMDAFRYACWIQEARDAGNYARADEVRAMSLGFGDHVVIDRDGTTVVQGPADEIARKVRIPDWGGYSEWVTPEGVDGRHILETCSKHNLPGQAKEMDKSRTKRESRKACYPRSIGSCAVSTRPFLTW